MMIRGTSYTTAGVKRRQVKIKDSSNKSEPQKN